MSATPSPAPSAGEEADDLFRRYPYLYAWAFEVGAPGPHMRSVAETAARDGAPPDVYVRRDWEVERRHPDHRRRAETAVANGDAVFVEDEHGQRVRVYYRVTAMTNALLRKRLEEFARDYARGDSPLMRGHLPPGLAHQPAHGKADHG